MKKSAQQITNGLCLSKNIYQWRNNSNIIIMAAFILLNLVSVRTDANNDSTITISKNYLSVEIDPAPFILGGYSVSLKFSPRKFNHFTLMASIYQSMMPDKMISSENYEKGFRNLQLNRSYAFFGDYFFKSNRSGFHFGPSVFLYDKSVELNSSVMTTSFKSIYPNARIGYVYKPFKNLGFYLNPWINVGKEFSLDDKNRIGNNVHSFKNINYILALHFGYGVNF